MSQIKTQPVNNDVDAYLLTVEPAKRRADGIELKKMFDSILKEKAVLWNNNMIGYGSYHYKSEKSKQEGDWPLTGFSPRKQNITVYIMSGTDRYKELLNELGKFKISSGSCIYINKLEDVNLDVLKKIILASVDDMKRIHSV